MNMETGAAGQGLSHWLRVLRPIGWWVLLVLILFGYRKHEEWSAKTRVSFKVTLQGKRAAGASVTLDGQPFMNGSVVAVGRHRLEVSHQKAGPFSTNFFLWYGEHDLGTIALKRTEGVLVLQVEPPALGLRITGPDWTRILTNSPGLTSSIPTDVYDIEARFLRNTESTTIRIDPVSTGLKRIAPHLGALYLTGSHTETRFQLRDTTETPIESGELPATISLLPVGSYKLTAEHHGDKRTETVVVREGATNETRVEFVYGAAFLETDPPGAAVVGPDGASLGTTPLRLSDLPPGIWKGELRLAEYESVPLSFTITANETNVFRTNLVSRNYEPGMRAARQYLKDGDPDGALKALEPVLRVTPKDAAARKLEGEAKLAAHLRRGEKLAWSGDLEDAKAEATAALALDAQNADAQALLKQIEARVAEKKQNDEKAVEQKHRERLALPGKLLEQATDEYRSVSGLVEEQKLEANMTAMETVLAILRSLRNEEPRFIADEKRSQAPDSFIIDARQELPSGLRRCLIVGAQTGEKETRILYKVLEYKTEAAIKFSIGALINAPASVNYVPLYPAKPDMTEKQKAQVREGVTAVTERLSRALGRRL